MLKLNQARFRNGWMIPNSMEWLFWPMGYAPPTPPDVKANDDGSLTYRVYIPQVIQQSLAGRYKITNREAFMAQMARLGVVKEQKQ